MITATVALPPSLDYPSAVPKPQARKDVGASQKQEIAGDKKTPSETRLANQDKAKTAQAQKQIDELKKIDQSVRAHEQAHLAAAGGLAMSGASFSFRNGPDGKQYAVGGEVSIDVSPGRTPQETISKAGRIQAAALAPADPSPQDRAVASAAEQMRQQAQQELSQEKLQASQETQPSARIQPGIASYRANSGTSGLAPGSIVDSTA